MLQGSRRKSACTPIYRKSWIWQCRWPAGGIVPTAVIRVVGYWVTDIRPWNLNSRRLCCCRSSSKRPTTVQADLQSFVEPNTQVRFAPPESRRWRHGAEVVQQRSMFTFRELLKILHNRSGQPAVCPSPPQPSPSCGRQTAFPLQADPLPHKRHMRHGPAQLIVDRLAVSRPRYGSRPGPEPACQRY